MLHGCIYLYDNLIEPPFIIGNRIWTWNYKQATCFCQLIIQYWFFLVVVFVMHFLFWSIFCRFTRWNIVVLLENLGPDEILRIPASSSTCVRENILTPIFLKGIVYNLCSLFQRFCSSDLLLVSNCKDYHLILMVIHEYDLFLYISCRHMKYLYCEP